MVIITLVLDIYTKILLNIVHSHKLTLIVIVLKEALTLDFYCTSSTVLYASCQIMVFHLNANKILFICNWLSKRK